MKRARSLADKLGIKPGATVLLVNPPRGYRAMLGPLPEGVRFTQDTEATAPVELIHFFTREPAELEARFAALKARLKPDGSFWVSWPKGGGKDNPLKEGLVRDVGLRRGLVDVKVAAVDETWSGLKFVYRLVDRP